MPYPEQNRGVGYPFAVAGSREYYIGITIRNI